MSLPTIKALWIGPALRQLEQISLLSFVAAGHPVHLFTYEAVDGVPEGVAVRDGREILPEARIIRDRRNGSVALFADLFRFALIGAEGGIWVDTDMVCHRPLDFRPDDYVFAWETEASVNCAVYGAPEGSGLAKYLRQIALSPPFLPTWVRRGTALRILGRLARLHYRGVADSPWGTYGPQLLTAAVKRFGLESEVRPRDVFYPVLFDQKAIFLEPAEQVEALLTERTRALHVWRHYLLGGADDAFPPGSYLDMLAKRYL